MTYNICENCGTNWNFIIKRYIEEKQYYEHMVDQYYDKMDDQTLQQLGQQLEMPTIFKLFQNKDLVANMAKKKDKEFFNNLFFVKYNIDRLCCRRLLITYIDYCPTNF